MHNLEIIEKAKEYLSRLPVDSAHGLDHHEAVAKNCIKIIEVEQLNLNTDAVVIAAWWHDLESQQGATDLLLKEMASAGFDAQTTEVTASVVRAHTYGKHQETLEAKVLYDADKMEYFNPERARKAVEDAQSGILEIQILAKHYQAWLDRYREVLTSFNFEYSRKIASDNLPATLEEIEKMGAFLETVKLKD